MTRGTHWEHLSKGLKLLFPVFPNRCMAFGRQIFVSWHRLVCSDYLVRNVTPRVGHRILSSEFPIWGSLSENASWSYFGLQYLLVPGFWVQFLKGWIQETITTTWASQKCQQNLDLWQKYVETNTIFLQKRKEWRDTIAFNMLMHSLTTKTGIQKRWKWILSHTWPWCHFAQYGGCKQLIPGPLVRGGQEKTLSRMTSFYFPHTTRFIFVNFISLNKN